ncbi:hypothetical protein B0T18DRAFT_489175 [Schizothecium vesticola]|uniref:Uncharacterized protein n=1 Tax=Schizothecium vesticola TaxID=314040 RepID=A0AA40EWM7_9PEZI|nr:hypothetical protein B0T18DRAFT_489175 [Schizothecium vesticola]
MDQPKTLASFFSGLRPRNRPERGGTLRPPPTTADAGRKPSSHSNSNNNNTKHHAAPSPSDKTAPPRRPSHHHKTNAPSPSPPPPPAAVDISPAAKHHHHHAARHALRKSGDFLGVTGVNPRTGEMDVLTPTTSSSEDTAGPRLARLARRAQEARNEYEAARGEVLREGAERRKEGRVGSAAFGGGAMASLSLRTRAFQLRFPSLIPTRTRSRGRAEGRSVAARDGGSHGRALMRMDGPVTKLRLEKQVSAERWAEAVNQDLDDVDSSSPGKEFTHGSLVRLTPEQRRDEEAPRRSAFTSIITTTGCGFSPTPCQPRRGCGAKADTSDHPMPDSADSTVMARLPMTRTHRSSSGSSERTDSWTCLDRAASPLAARPNSWPSTAGGRVSYPTTLQVVVDGRVVATIGPASSSKVASPGPPSDTISVLDETATSDSGEAASPQQQQEPPRLRGGNQRHKEMRKTMRRNGGDESVGGQSRSSTPTGRSHWWTTAARSELGRKPASGPRGGLDTALMAREAARTAYCCGNRAPTASPGASSGTVAVVGHGGAPLPQPVPATLDEDQNDEDKNDEDKNDEHPLPLPPAAVEGDTGDPVSTTPPAVEPAPAPGSEWGQPGDSPILVLQAVLTVVAQVGAAYWRLIKPVFIADSAVRQRFEQGKSTWDDFALYVLAVLFLLLGALAAVWMYRGLVGLVSEDKGMRDHMALA